MNKEILNTKVQDFIKNYTDDINKLAFAGSPFPKVTVQELMQQIESRRKIKKKLPKWYQSDAIYYPPKLNLEQTSSEITAQYKSSLYEGTIMSDITGGFGVDTYYFSTKFQTVHYFEHNEVLSEIASYNFKVLGRSNIKCVASDGLEDLASRRKYDLIYMDPSRRRVDKRKIFLLSDSEPDVTSNLSELLSKCGVLMLKTSPMLDISAGLDELKYVKEIHIVAVANEVKELLWFIKKDFIGQPDIYTINITKDTVQKFNFNLDSEAIAIYDIPGRYLYEPNAALMKSGAFDSLSEAFNVSKLHKHSHLYTSEFILEFPGRSFEIQSVIPYTKKAMRDGIPIKKANIATRNFPESVATIRKKWGFKDGGDQYLFFTTLIDDRKVVLVCSRI